MKVDQNTFPMHTHVLELKNPKVLIQPNQAESAKGKNVIIGEERPEKKMQQNKTSRDPSTLGGQDKRKTNNKFTGLTGSRGGLTGTKTGLTGACREFGSFSRNKTMPSFKELLAKYEKQEVIQKKEK
jgi:hypothetical protein